MTREKAINEIKSWDFLEGKEIEAIHTLIPELAESEDERIRKALIEGVSQIRCKGDITREQMIAYLEKQKEQKPAEWSEEDEKNLELITDCVYEFYPDPVMKYKLKDWLRSLRPQPKKDGGDDYNKGYIKGRDDTLKEFNDMASWKPSEDEEG